MAVREFRYDGWGVGEFKRMHVDGTQLRSAWRDVVPQSGSEYTLCGLHDPWFVGCTVDGWPALLRRLSSAPTPSTRSMGAIRVRHMRDADLELSSSQQIAHLTAIECRDTALVETFVVLALDLINHVGDGPTNTRALQQRLGHWRDLLASRPPLDESSQLGLWGELEILERCGDLDTAVESWQGPASESIDFMRNATGLEVKTSKKRLIHWLQWNQAVFGTSSLDVYLASVHVAADPTGASLHDKVKSVLSRLRDPYIFREKLIQARYQEVATYDTSWVLVEDPLVFSMAQVPSFAALPDGILDARWRVDMTGKKSLSAALTHALFATLVG